MKQLSVLGLSRSGKTCYLYAMAKTMLRGYECINVVAKQDDTREVLRRGWKKIRTDAIWPLGTDASKTLEFSCSLNLSPIMDFLWNDYRGGTLTSFNENDLESRRELASFLQSSDGLIIFIASDELLDILNNELDSDLKLNDLDDLMEIFLQNMETLAKIPITIVISKADLLSLDDKNYAFEMVNQIFSTLFVRGNNTRVLVVPICIGTNLGRGSQGESINGSVFANPQDGNIHIPILFNLYNFLTDEITKEKERLEDTKSRRYGGQAKLRTANEQSMIRNWWDGIDKDEITRQIGQSQQQEETINRKIQDLEKKLESVAKLFSGDCKYYVNGQIVEL